MKNKNLKNYKFIITAGGTQEPIDPVRYIGNHSSGKMGIAILKAALKTHCKITFVYANITEQLPKGSYKKFYTPTAKDMYETLKKEFTPNSILIMAAAVADFKVKKIQKNKIKKENLSSLNLELVPNRDILKSLSRIKTNQKLIGFAAESQSLLENAQKKLKAKKLDMIIANDISNPDIGFGSDYNQVYFITKSDYFKSERISKNKLGEMILKSIQKLL